MFSTRIRAGIRAGLVAAAATGGAITGFGIRHGDWSGPFATLGAQVMRSFGIVDAPPVLALGTGVAAHIAWMVLWGITFGTLAHRKSLAMTMALAVFVGAGAALAARALVPAALGATRFAAMPGTQAALCVALMTVGLVTGRAFAGSGPDRVA